MIDPIIGLPWMVGCMVEFIVSMKRIQKFLLADEINPSLIHKQHNSNLTDLNQPAFSIDHASNFYWGTQKAKADEDKDKDEKTKDKKEEH